MDLKKSVVFLVVLLASAKSMATFLPENDLWRQDSIYALDGASTMTEEQFNTIIDKVSAAMAPSIDLHGGVLTVERRWNDPMVNASSRQMGSDWRVYMFGGLARRPEITQDGFAMIACHEFGHHLGGFPFYGFYDTWAASEGQADYFASQVCARRVWQNDKKENAQFQRQVNPYAKSQCDKVWHHGGDRNLCYRIAVATSSLAMMLNTLNKQAEINFSQPDPLVVKTTNLSYPSNQCRVDTYLNASVCKANFDLAVIPARNLPAGQSSADAEKTAAQYSCMKASGYSVGLRPACWFKPNL